MAYASPGNMSTATSVFRYFNTTVDNWFFPGIILAVWFIILIKMKFNNNDTGKSFAAASFMCMILTVMARVLDFVSTGFMSMFIIMTAVGGLWIHIENG